MPNEEDNPFHQKVIWSDGYTAAANRSIPVSEILILSVSESASRRQ
jgi:hypothetical protein